jgi:SAM-dependent methyltransferase
MDEIANTDMAAGWDGPEGERWAHRWEHYDRSMAAHHAALMQAAAVRPTDAVLDVGCGNGTVTLDAAGAAVDGSALGVDLGAQMLEVGRRRAAEAGLANAGFEQADAQVHPFPPDRYDLVVSRFGSMFFADAVAAFSNLHRALRPGGRLVLATWRTVEHNEWIQVFPAALALGRDVPMPVPSTPGPVGLADPDHVRSVLSDAGFADVGLEPLDLPFVAGTDADEAFEFARTLGITVGMLRDLDEPSRTAALGSLRQAMVDHVTADGVVFASGIWVVTAVRP